MGYKIKLEQRINEKMQVEFYINAPDGENLGTEMALNGWGLTTPCRYKKVYTRVCNAVNDATGTKNLTETQCDDAKDSRSLRTEEDSNNITAIDIENSMLRG